MTKKESEEIHRLREIEKKWNERMARKGFDEEQMKYIRKMPVELVKNKL